MKPSLPPALRPLAASLRRRRFRAGIRESDVFIVSFPKSGKTWLLYMLASLFRADGGEDPLSRAGVQEVVPDVNREYRRGRRLGYPQLPNPRVFAVHAACDLALPKVVYLVRDPRDVLVSFWHYTRLTVAGFDTDLPSYVDAPTWPDDWDEHVEGWLDSGHPSLLLLSYEEMKADAAAALRRVVDFVGLHVADADLERAVAGSSFERMQDAEDRFGFGVHGELPHANERFVRKGVVGGWRDELDAAARDVIEGRYGPLMLRLGYELSS